jgi:hypothetical protein
MNTDAMNTEQPQESFGSGASEAPAARSAELRSLPTPGPWSIHEHMGGMHITETEYFTAHTAYIGAGDVLIAEVSAYKHHDGSDGGGYPRVTDFAVNEANANLIKAAPELAEQLLEALEFIEDCSDVSDGPDGSPRPNRAMQLCEPIRAALAKAGVKP